MSRHYRPSRSGGAVATLGSLLLVFGLAAGFTNPAWQDPEGASQTLTNAGFEPTDVGGYAWFSCGKGDLWHTKFKAKNPQGKEVSGAVCKGLMKGSTIRFD